MRAIVAVLDRRGMEAVSKTAEMLKILRHKGADAFYIATPKHFEMKVSPNELNSNIKSSTALGHIFLKILPEDKPKVAQRNGVAIAFDGRTYPPEEILNLILSTPDLHRSLETIVSHFEGSFSFALAEDGWLVVARDSLGLYPVYYGENRDLFAVSSERKALWKIGLEKTEQFPPGHIGVFNRDGFNFTPIHSLRFQEFSQEKIKLETAIEQLTTLLEHSINNTLLGVSEVSVAFSGGLDSSLTALLAHKAGAKVHLIHVSLKGKAETVKAEMAAEALGMPLHTYIYEMEDVESAIPKVLWAVEDPDPLKTCIGIPVFWSAERSRELGFNVMLMGMGADELFGGYKRYFEAYIQHGEEKAQNMLYRDVLEMYQTNFERDVKICNFQNVELRLPFASRQLVEFSLNLPLSYKIASPENHLRKIILRKAAEKMGLSRHIALSSKRAIQYSTGVSLALKKLAEKKGMRVKDYLRLVFNEVFENVCERMPETIKE
ncbi:MAG: asparagine synthetase B [Candidatus Bathyarchaeia archaeon]